MYSSFLYAFFAFKLSGWAPGQSADRCCVECTITCDGLARYIQQCLQESFPLLSVFKVKVLGHDVEETEHCHFAK